MARLRSDDMPARVERVNGGYYYRPGALGRAVGESVKSIPLGRDRAAAAARAVEFEALLRRGLRLIAPEVTKERVATMVNRSRARARQLRRGHDIDVQFIQDLVRRQGGVCAITGLSFTFERGRHRTCPWAPSIDRIDSAGGYTKENVRVVCHAVNVALNEWGPEILWAIASAISRRVLKISRKIDREIAGKPLN